MTTGIIILIIVLSTTVLGGVIYAVSKKKSATGTVNVGNTVIPTPTPTPPQIKCVAGTYLKNPTDTECTSCPAGSYSTDNAVSCTPCPAGQYSASITSSSCTPCPAGQYNTTTGATGCSACAVGSYSMSQGSTGCTQCPSGQTTQVAGSTSSTACKSTNPCSGDQGWDAATSKCINCSIFGASTSYQGLDHAFLQGCKCPLNYYNGMLGICQQCPSGSSVGGSGPGNSLYPGCNCINNYEVWMKNNAGTDYCTSIM